MKNTKGMFTMVYFQDFQNQPINLTEYVLLNLIESFNQNNRDCYLSNSQLAKTLKVSERTINRMIQHLRDLNLITTKNGSRLKVFKGKMEPYVEIDLEIKELLDSAYKPRKNG